MERIPVTAEPVQGNISPEPRQTTLTEALFEKSESRISGRGHTDWEPPLAQEKLYRPHSKPASAAKMALAELARSVELRIWYRGKSPATVVAPSRVPPSARMVIIMTWPEREAGLTGCNSGRRGCIPLSSGRGRWSR